MNFLTLADLPYAMDNQNSDPPPPYDPRSNHYAKQRAAEDKLKYPKNHRLPLVCTAEEVDRNYAEAMNDLALWRKTKPSFPANDNHYDYCSYLQAIWRIWLLHEIQHSPKKEVSLDHVIDAGSELCDVNRGSVNIWTRKVISSVGFLDWNPDTNMLTLRTPYCIGPPRTDPNDVGSP